MRSATRLDPVLICLLTLAGVATAGFALDRATAAAQVMMCWFLSAVMHLAVVVMARGRSAERPRLGIAVALAGAVALGGDLHQLTTVIADPAGAAAVPGALPQGISAVAAMIILAATLLMRAGLGLRDVAVLAISAVSIAAPELAAALFDAGPRWLMAITVLAATLFAAVTRTHGHAVPTGSQVARIQPPFDAALRTRNDTQPL